jgi:hypothetical protein
VTLLTVRRSRSTGDLARVADRDRAHESPDRIVSTVDGAGTLNVDVAGSDAPLRFVRAPIRR